MFFEKDLKQLRHLKNLNIKSTYWLFSEVSQSSGFALKAAGYNKKLQKHRWTFLFRFLISSTIYKVKNELFAQVNYSILELKGLLSCVTKDAEIFM